MISTKDISSIGKGHVLDADGGKVGSVGQFFLDNTTGEPAWVTVHTGLFGTKHSFVPLSGATVSGGDVQVPFDKAKIKDAPRVVADGELTPAEEDELYTYYGVHGDDRGRDHRDSDDRGRDHRDSDDRDSDQRGANDVDSRGHTVDTDLNSHGMVDAQAAAVGGAVGGAVGPSEGHDSSGHDAGAATTRREDQPHAGTRTEQAGPTRIRRYIVTEQQTITVPVTHEEYVVEHEPTAGDAPTGEVDESSGRHSDQR